MHERPLVYWIGALLSALCSSTDKTPLCQYPSMCGDLWGRGEKSSNLSEYSFLAPRSPKKGPAIRHVE